MIPGPGLPFRVAAFARFAAETAIHGEVLAWLTRVAGFDDPGGRLALVGLQGIFEGDVSPR